MSLCSRSVTRSRLTGEAEQAAAHALETPAPSQALVVFGWPLCRSLEGSSRWQSPAYPVNLLHVTNLERSDTCGAPLAPCWTLLGGPTDWLLRRLRVLRGAVGAGLFGGGDHQRSSAKLLGQQLRHWRPDCALERARTRDPMARVHSHRPSAPLSLRRISSPGRRATTASWTPSTWLRWPPAAPRCGPPRASTGSPRRPSALAARTAARARERR